MTATQQPDFKLIFESTPNLYLILLPDPPTFTIIAVNDAYAQATNNRREEILGRGLFEVFPDNPDDLTASGVGNLRSSLLEVIATKAPNIMPVQKYDIPRSDGEGDGFEVRYWGPVNTPVLGQDGMVQYIIHRVEDVTKLLESQHAEAAQSRLTSSLRSQAGEMQSELSLRDQLLADARHRMAERERASAALAERMRFAALGADIGIALTQTLTLSNALQSCAEAFARHLEAVSAYIWTLDDSAGMLELRAKAGPQGHLYDPQVKVPIGFSTIGLIAQGKQYHFTNNVANDPGFQEADWARSGNTAAFAGYPLVVEGYVVGVVGLFASRTLPRGTLAALRSATDSIAIGIDRKRAEDTLTRQSEELARSNADLQHFAYATSHDLQEPLRTMIGFADVLSRRYGGQLGGDGEKCLTYITNGATRMSALIESMLTYSRVTNVETMPFEAVQLESVLGWSMMNLQTVMEETNTTLTKEPLPDVCGDQVQLVQLFQNLIGNAIKYRSDRPLEIHVAAYRQEDEWLITLQDNGIGLEQKYGEKIFGMFKRLHGRSIPGTGIGLAVCRKIVERHRGRIWVRSEIGKGATFCFTLPANTPSSRLSLSDCR